jgi:predicted SAM-dependent methyltransferase
VIRLQVGCGNNKLPGWENHDADMDITKPLPFEDGSVDIVFGEHILEHLDCHEAYRFLEECYRILRFGGAVRMAVPSVVRIFDLIDLVPTYLEMAKSKKGAVTGIIFNHGHKSMWSMELLNTVLQSIGFDTVVAIGPGMSDNPDLCGLEGHQREIGEEWNNLETIVIEGYKK